MEKLVVYSPIMPVKKTPQKTGKPKFVNVAISPQGHANVLRLIGHHGRFVYQVIENLAAEAVKKLKAK